MNPSDPAVPAASLRLYFVLAFIIGWAFWLVPVLGSHGVFALPGGARVICTILGSYAPFIATIVVLARSGGWRALGRFGKRALRIRMAPGILLASLLLVPLLGWLAAWIWSRLGGPGVALAVPAGQIPLLFVIMFFVGGSVNEEFGWAYAIDGLCRGRSLLTASVVLGVIWACWHLPLFFIVGQTQSFLPFWAFVIFAVALRVLFGWAYEGAGKSILVTLFFHTTTNLTLNLFVLVDRSPQRDESGFIALALLMLAAAAVVAWMSKCYRRAPILAEPS